MTELRLRDYQSAAIDAVFKAWSGGMRRPAIVLPTGAGKTVVFSHLVDEFRRRHTADNRVMILVHRDELADQAINKIKQIAPHLHVGKVKANDDDISADVMVCSVQTVSRPTRLAGLRLRQNVAGRVGLIITDECHHAAAVSYGTVYDAFPDALQLGVTATLARGDGVGLGSVWEDVVYERSILNLIGKGHLVAPRGVTVDVDGLDLGGVGKSHGDYKSSALGASLEESGADRAIAKAYQEHAADRPGVVFTPTVATAEQTSEALHKIGIRAATVTGETPSDDRHQIYEDFRTGRTQVLVNCMVLTEGFDAPWASCAVIARPTMSQPLYVQMVGRVLRPYPGKKDALVLNLAGAGGTLRTLIDLEPGAVESVREGESLTEAVEREEKEGESHIPAGHPAFGLKYKDVDLFKGSAMHWLRTDGGVMFIGAGNVTIFLWPSAQTGQWDVCRVEGHNKWQRTQHTGLNLSLAMAWAEAVAEDESEFSTRRSASWRKGKASQAQRDYATALGIQVEESATKSQVSDAIAVKLESRRFDPYLGA